MATTETMATTTEMMIVTRTKEDSTGETKGEKLAITNADGATTTTRV